MTPRSSIQRREDDWVRAARLGDREAQAAIVRRFQKPVFHLCAQLVSPREAEDLAQESLTRVLSKLDTFRGNSDLGTWIYRITTNTCLTHLRRRARSPLQPNSDALAEPSDDSGVQTSDTSAELRKALDQLSEEHRTMLLLRDVQGLEYEQLAAVLEIPVGTVRSRLFRARQALRDILETQS